eukprot:4371612-Pleurochrysis_carterae.AAC.1
MPGIPRAAAHCDAAAAADGDDDAAADVAPPAPPALPAPLLSAGRSPCSYLQASVHPPASGRKSTRSATQLTISRPRLLISTRRPCARCVSEIMFNKRLQHSRRVHQQQLRRHAAPTRPTSSSSRPPPTSSTRLC